MQTPQHLARHGISMQPNDDSLLKKPLTFRSRFQYIGPTMYVCIISFAA